jgi:hypothetical protein
MNNLTLAFVRPGQRAAVVVFADLTSECVDHRQVGLVDQPFVIAASVFGRMGLFDFRRNSFVVFCSPPL